MQTSKLLPALAFAAATLVSSLFAQGSEPAAAAADSGVIGKRYVEVGAFILNYNHTSDDGYAVGTTVNAPVSACLDVGATFEHNWLEGDRSENFQDLSAYVTYHRSYGWARSFLRAELGYEWWHVSDDPYYSLDVGMEFPLTERLAVSAALNWSEFLASDWNGGAFAGKARAYYWLTDTVAASLRVTAFEGGTWSYGAAVLWKF
jgi:hypothetical protein